MKSFVLFIAIACSGTSFLFFTAAKEASNPGWAYQICREASWFCHNPQLLAVLAVGLEDCLARALGVRLTALA